MFIVTLSWFGDWVIHIGVIVTLSWFGDWVIHIGVYCHTLLQLYSDYKVLGDERPYTYYKPISETLSIGANFNA